MRLEFYRNWAPIGPCNRSHNRGLWLFLKVKRFSRCSHSFRDTLALTQEGWAARGSRSHSNSQNTTLTTLGGTGYSVSFNPLTLLGLEPIRKIFFQVRNFHQAPCCLPTRKAFKFILPFSLLQSSIERHIYYCTTATVPVSHD